MNFDSFLNLNSKKKRLLKTFFFPFLLSLYEPVMCSLLTVTSYIRVLRFFFVSEVFHSNKIWITYQIKLIITLTCLFCANLISQIHLFSLSNKTFHFGSKLFISANNYLIMERKIIIQHEIVMKKDKLKCAVGVAFLI